MTETDTYQWEEELLCKVIFVTILCFNSWKFLATFDLQYFEWKKMMKVKVNVKCIMSIK